MPEAAGPVAPAPGTPAPTAQPGDGPAAQTPALSGKPPGRIPGEQPRENGKFASPNGKPGEVKPKPVEPEAKPYRFKKPITVFGQKRELDLDEEGLERELSRGQAALMRTKDAQDKAAAADRILALAKENPEAFLAEHGHDIDALAQKRLASRAQLETMSEHERRAYELEQENKKLKADFEKNELTAKEQAKAQRVAEARQANVNRYTEALKLANEPATYETIYLMAEADRAALEEGRELSAAQLVKEAQRRLDNFTGRYVKDLSGEAFEKRLGPHMDKHLASMEGPALVKRLGPALVQKILEATVSEFEASQSFEPRPDEVARPSSLESEKPREYIDEQEVNRRARLIR